MPIFPTYFEIYIKRLYIYIENLESRVLIKIDYCQHLQYKVKHFIFLQKRISCISNFNLRKIVIFIKIILEFVYHKKILLDYFVLKEFTIY